MKDKIFHFLTTPSKKQLIFIFLWWLVAASLITYGNSDSFSEEYLQKSFIKDYFILIIGLVLIGKASFKYWKNQKQNS